MTNDEDHIVGHLQFADTKTVSMTDNLLEMSGRLVDGRYYYATHRDGMMKFGLGSDLDRARHNSYRDGLVVYCDYIRSKHDEVNRLQQDDMLRRAFMAFVPESESYVRPGRRDFRYGVLNALLVLLVLVPAFIILSLLFYHFVDTGLKLYDVYSGDYEYRSRNFEGDVLAEIYKIAMYAFALAVGVGVVFLATTKTIVLSVRSFLGWHEYHTRATGWKRRWSKVSEDK